MATFKYFAECAGQAVELTAVAHDGSAFTTARHFAGKCPTCGGRHQVDRKVERKSNPSMHPCSPRCQNATGFLCECACNGRNHGRGAFTCAAAA